MRLATEQKLLATVTALSVHLADLEAFADEDVETFRLRFGDDVLDLLVELRPEIETSISEQAKIVYRIENALPIPSDEVIDDNVIPFTR